MPMRTPDGVETLVRDGTPEGITLDYKGDFTNNLDAAKKELAKDVCAFANAQGGTLLIGIGQDKATGEPQWPPVGVPRRVNGRQPTDEWIGQALNQNIAQRVNLTIHPLELDDSERCVIVIEVPPSPRAPHMVTYQQDNRFYRRYFRRHQFESLPAEEYEVREMFQRGLRYADAVATLLDERGFLDRRRDSFGQNELTVRLLEWQHPEQPVTSFVSFLAVPAILTPDALDFSSPTLMRWIQSCRLGAPPPTHISIVPDMLRYTLDGVLCTRSATNLNDATDKLTAYMLMERSGYIEYARTGLIGTDNAGERTYLALTSTLGHYWAFIAWVCALYREANVTGSFRVYCNVTGTSGSFLSDFAEGWRDSDIWHPREARNYALDQHLQIMHELPHVEQSEAELEELIRQTDIRVEQAYNCSGEPRAFRQPQRTNPNRFDFAKLRYWQ